MKPLAVDLFCGCLKKRMLVSQAKSMCRCHAAIQQRMASRAQNPEHMPLGGSSGSPRTIPRKFGPVGDIQHAGFPAALTFCWKVRESAAQPFNNAPTLYASWVFVFMAVPHLLAISIIPLVKFGARFASALPGAFVRTIPLVSAWRGYIEVLAAHEALAAGFRNVRLFQPPQPASSRLASQ